MKTISFGADDIRTILHLLGVAVWLGGQILMLGLLPVLRKLGDDAPRQVARGFGRVAWPAFGIVIITGIWNMLSVDMSTVSVGYNIAFGVKLLLVMVTGFAAFAHQRTTTPAVKAVTGALGLVASLAALVLGVMMAH